MDTSVIENTQVVNIFEVLLGANGVFSTNINIDFIPNVMNVKIIQYSGIENYISTIYTDIVNNNIGSILNQLTSNPQTRFLIYDRQIRGTYTFKILNEFGDIEPARIGSVYIQLEFVKYKTVKEQKMY